MLDNKLEEKYESKNEDYINRESIIIVKAKP